MEKNTGLKQVKLSTKNKKCNWTLDVIANQKRWEIAQFAMPLPCKHKGPILISRPHTKSHTVHAGNPSSRETETRRYLEPTGQHLLGVLQVKRPLVAST